MPELPEVETIRRGLKSVLVGKRLKTVTLHRPTSIRGKAAVFRQQLEGKRVQDIRRRGKLLIGVFSGKTYLLMHLKMTGQLLYQAADTLIAGGHPWQQEALPSKHTHVEFHFDDGSTLFFNDIRRFGYLKIVDDVGLTQALATYGPEILETTFTPTVFGQQLSSRTVAIKAALLNQAVVAGIGNIYADEICFAAGILPHRSSASLSVRDIEALHKASKTILRTAVRHRGTTFRNYQDTEGKTGNFSRFLKVYGRAGERCVTCQAVLQRTQVAGRGTVYCATCQT